jgi:sortase A
MKKKRENGHFKIKAVYRDGSQKGFKQAYVNRLESKGKATIRHKGSYQFFAAMALTIALAGSLVSPAWAYSYRDPDDTADPNTSYTSEQDYDTDNSARFTWDYSFESGVDYDEALGQPTTTDQTVSDPSNQNIRRNKDVSDEPLPYGVYSAEIDTDQANPYITPDSTAYAVQTPTADTVSDTAFDNGTDNSYFESKSTVSNVAGGTVSGVGVGAGTSSSATAATGASTVTIGGQTDNNASDEFAPSRDGNISYSNTVNNSNSGNTISANENVDYMTYSDGSIGSMSIPAINEDCKVYEGETTDSMRKGAAHFSDTALWTGNVGLCGHNNTVFKDLKDLDMGDKITYKTKLGTRTYEVASIQKIANNDFSYLGTTDENKLTLITCVHNVPSQRLVIVADEI